MGVHVQQGCYLGRTICSSRWQVSIGGWEYKMSQACPEIGEMADSFSACKEEHVVFLCLHFDYTSNFVSMTNPPQAKNQWCSQYGGCIILRFWCILWSSVSSTCSVGEQARPSHHTLKFVSIMNSAVVWIHLGFQKICVKNFYKCDDEVSCDQKA